MTAIQGRLRANRQIVSVRPRTAARSYANYFQVGTVSGAYRALERYTAQRLRGWLQYKHKAWHSRAGRFYDSYRMVNSVWCA
jgi:hypothetical protein